MPIRGGPDSFIVRLARKMTSLILFVLLWQLLVQTNVMSPLMFGNLPSPWEVWNTFMTVLTRKIYYHHILASLYRIILGSLLALPIAVVIGLIIGRSKLAEDFILPILDILRPIPQIAWIPVAILLFPSVEGSIVYITFLGAFFPILINTISGVENVSATLITTARSMDASEWQLLRYVYFPSAIPNIFTGFTVGVGISWMSVIAAEMISGKYGIGYYTWTSYTLMAYAETIVGMMTIGAMGTLCFWGIKLFERYVLRWRADKGGE